MGAGAAPAADRKIGPAILYFITPFHFFPTPFADPTSVGTFHKSSFLFAATYFPVVNFTFIVNITTSTADLKVSALLLCHHTLYAASVLLAAA
jgi:hypothetical protein